MTSIYFPDADDLNPTSLDAISNFITTDSTSYDPDATDFVVSLKVSIPQTIEGGYSSVTDNNVMPQANYNAGTNTWDLTAAETALPTLFSVLFNQFTLEDSELSVQEIALPDYPDVNLRGEDDYVFADDYTESPIVSLILQTMINDDSSVGDVAESYKIVFNQKYPYSNLEDVANEVSTAIKNSSYVSKLANDDDAASYDTVLTQLKDIKVDGNPSTSTTVNLIESGDEWYFRMKVKVGGYEVTYLTLKICYLDDLSGGGVGGGDVLN